MEPIYKSTTTTDDKNDDGSSSSSSAAFDLYGTSVICAVSKELLDEVRAVILDDLPTVDWSEGSIYLLYSNYYEWIREEYPYE